jgi:hypothetical protein
VLLQQRLASVVVGSHGPAPLGRDVRARELRERRFERVEALEHARLAPPERRQAPGHQLELQLAQVVVAERDVGGEVARAREEALATDPWPPALEDAGPLRGHLGTQLPDGDVELLGAGDTIARFLGQHHRVTLTRPVRRMSPECEARRRAVH